MNSIGIDIGSDSVRLSVCKGIAGFDLNIERPLERKKNGNKHTMSGVALWTQILSMAKVYEESLEASLRHQLSSNSATNESGGTSSETTTAKSIMRDAQVGLKDNFELVAGLANTCTEKPEAQASLRQDVSIKEKPEKLAHKTPASAVCVAATCSMVVMQRVVNGNGRYFFKSVLPGEEVIVWMDTRARAEAQWVASKLPKTALDLIGGTVTPEMGIAKLKWIDNNYQTAGNEICVFELYDWISYVFLAGGYQADGSVPCLANDSPSFASGSMAMDGSVKGWGEDILQMLEISTRVCCTPNTYDAKNPFVFVGTPLGKIGNLLVAHGCIDCYAGWAGQVALDARARARAKDAKSTATAGPAPSSLLMVAGTSTCFIASVDPSRASSIAGLWGPFSQLLESPVYSFGQPSTGQLFSELFKEYSEIISGEAPFSFLERGARTIEEEYGHSLTVLSRHYFYYGDKYGNRSPYGDFRMGEVFVDGVNAGSCDSFSCSMSGSSLEVLVLKYYLIMEFLVFQTRQLCQRLSETCGPVSDVYISGSQAQNTRFTSMLAKTAFSGSRVYVKRKTDTKFAGSQGIALSMDPHIPDSGQMSSAEDGHSAWSIVSLSEQGGSGERETNILTAKYRAHEEMAKWQKSFHESMAEL